MDELRIRHARLRKRIGGTKVLDNALVDYRRDVLALARHGVAMRRAGLVITHLIQGRHIGTGNCRELLDNLSAGDALVAQAAMQLTDLEQRLLALANQDGIEEGRIRLGVIHRRSAGDDDGIVLGTVGSQQRNAGEIERLEKVCHSHLVRHVHTDDVERGHGRCALERQQRNPRLAHGIAHIGPRYVAALAGNALGLIKDVVENGDALVGQTDLIHVRIDHAAAIVGIGLRERAPLVVDIATRLLDLGEQRLDQMKTVLVWNAQQKTPKQRDQMHLGRTP